MNEERFKAKKEEIMTAIKESGFRMTRQRDLIVATVLERIEKEDVAPGMQEILTSVQELDPSIGMATIYRTVEVLSKLGFISLIDQGEGFNRVTLNQGDITIHAFCRNCGKSISIPNEKDLVDSIRELTLCDEFTLLPQAFRICGICDDCRNEGVSLEDLPPGRGRGMGRRCRRRRGYRED